MSNLSDNSKNDNISGDVNITGSSGSTDSSDSSDRTVASAEQVARTLHYLSDVSDIPTPRRLVAPTGYAREGIQRLRQIMQMRPTTRPDRFFMEELNGVQAIMQISRVVDLTEEEDAVAARMARYLSTSGREETPDEESESSGSVTPPGEPI
ncbi:hypothetical protein TIFTF001_007813 [Ficus carica]|uniref:Uncharacterized protein n=1 Tax=Ficus carica TaxID=3494 RepID=A0AA88D175_FICCA|nr:hypothetical protein TIFTF001_007813 [Ficus carica]